MEIDFKSILLVLVIIAVVVGTIFLGYSIMSNDENSNLAQEEIENNDAINNIKNNNKLQNTVQNEYENIEQGNTSIEEDEIEEPEIEENNLEDVEENELDKPQEVKPLEINNNFPKTSFGKQKYNLRRIDHKLQGGNVFNYRVPDTWKDNPRNYFEKLSYFGEFEMTEQGYQDFIKEFMRKKSAESSSLDFNSARVLENNDLIIVHSNVNGFITEYMPLIYNGYVYYVSMVCKEEDYENKLETINNIFASCYISY